jgi:hypothetical protein
METHSHLTGEVYQVGADSEYLQPTVRCLPAVSENTGTKKQGVIDASAFDYYDPIEYKRDPDDSSRLYQ